MEYHCYHTSPIDIWFGTFTAEQLHTEIWKYFSQNWESIARFCDHLQEVESKAKEAFLSLNWEEDIIDGPYYFALPCPHETEMLIGYIIKQGNNGSCFIASPKELEYLDQSEKITIQIT